MAKKKSIPELASIDAAKLMRAIADQVSLGELHVTLIDPPGTPDGVMRIELMSSSPTAWAQLKKDVSG